MTTITKKQTTIALVVAAFTAIMFAGPIALNSGVNFAFAGDEHHHHHHHFHHFHHFFRHHHHHFFFNHHHHNHGKHSSIHQSISQSCHQHQHSTVLSAGANSPISSSGNNIAACVNANSGGNAAANNQ